MLHMPTSYFLFLHYPFFMYSKLCLFDKRGHTKKAGRRKKTNSPRWQRSKLTKEQGWTLKTVTKVFLPAGFAYEMNVRRNLNVGDTEFRSRHVSGSKCGMGATLPLISFPSFSSTISALGIFTHPSLVRASTGGPVWIWKRHSFM